MIADLTQAVADNKKKEWLCLVLSSIPMACQARGARKMLDLHHQLLLAHSTLACTEIKPGHSTGPSPKPAVPPFTGLLSPLS